jgi:hypothetical protein
MRRSELARGRLLLGGALLLSGVGGAVSACSQTTEPAPATMPDMPETMPPDAAGGEAGAGGLPSVPVAVTSRRSRRGAGCSVKNDCAEGLSCIRGLCEPTSFGLLPSGKECVQIDCTTSADCCGKLSPDIPEKCRGRAAFCLQKLPGCVAEPCSRSRDCGGGAVCTGHCVVTNGECSGNVDCLANKCLGGTCSLNFTACSTDADCAANLCSGGTCSCANPSYEPTNPICLDKDCDGLCLWACEDSRCVIPSTCESDDDCLGAKPMCVKGQCVECESSADCSFDKICRQGSCETPCDGDANCPLFEACQAGECINVGCRSDRECTLLPDVNALELPPGFDPRLLRCHTENGVGRCLIPCQTDAQCAATETCSGGLCKYIGCDSTEECKTIIGLHDQLASDTQPWIPSVECRADDTK